VVSEQVVKLTSWVGMAPKKNRKQVSETRPEKPVEDLVAPSESIGEEEPNSREDQDEPEVGFESEEEQRSSVLFTPEQLEILLKMNRPDFGELVAPSKRGPPRVKGFNRPSPGTSVVPETEKLWMLGLPKWKTTYMPPRLVGIRHGACSILLEGLCRHLVADGEAKRGQEPWLYVGVFQGPH